MLTYYPVDKTIDMFDIKNNRIFLKRCEYPQLVLGDCYIGAVLTVNARLLKIIDYGDVYTRTKFEQERQRTFALILPQDYLNIGKAIDFIFQQGFQISKLKMGKLTPEQARNYIGERDQSLADSLSKDVAVGIEIVGQQAISKYA